MDPKVNNKAIALAHEIHGMFASAYAIEEKVNHEWLENTIKQYSKEITKIEVEKSRSNMIEKVKTVFSIYITLFPNPRDAEQKAMQDVIKNSVRNLKERVIETL